MDPDTALSQHLVLFTYYSHSRLRLQQHECVPIHAALPWDAVRMVLQTQLYTSHRALCACPFAVASTTRRVSVVSLLSLLLLLSCFWEPTSTAATATDANTMMSVSQSFRHDVDHEIIDMTTFLLDNLSEVVPESLFVVSTS